MKFLYNAPALLHKGALIVGDTHFGMEGRLSRRGIFDGQFSMRLFLKLKGLIERHRAKKLIMLGDVKEDVTMLDSATADVLAKLSMLCEVTIVRGNHDGGIGRCGSAKIVGPGGMVYEGLGLAHGHAWPDQALMECDYLVTGHQHPLVTMSDTLGKRHSEPVWIIADADREKIARKYAGFNPGIRLVLMPAFNPLVGSGMNSTSEERLGPILNNNLFKLNDALVFRLDGTRLGKLKTIM
jgi:putative SbcD/Mre11-related phosphoesterase